MDGVRLGGAAGFQLVVHWSVGVLLWLFTWNLAAYSLPHNAPGHAAETYWIAGLLGALVLLGSLLAHELAHAVVARRAGVEVTVLTLWLFGGVAGLAGEAKTPSEDFRIAAAGPATSFALAGVFAGSAVALDALGLAHIVVTVAWWLAVMNLVLGLFNLIPGAPLDGGRILRAYLWRRRGDRTRAAAGAARSGRFVGSALIALGLIQFLVGAVMGGLWTIFIGGFLLTAARAEKDDALSRRALVGVRVVEVMSPDPVGSACTRSWTTTYLATAIPRIPSQTLTDASSA